MDQFESRALVAHYLLKLSDALVLLNQKIKPSGDFALNHLMQIMSLMFFASDCIKGPVIFR